jgi:hypothetical protein
LFEAQFPQENIVGRTPRVCFLGCGGGAVPSCVQAFVCPNSRVCVVDASSTAVDAARRYFFLPDRVDAFLGDGVKHARDHRETYDVIVVDVADPFDRFLPPDSFFQSLQDQADALAKTGREVFVMNVLPSANRPCHVGTAARAFLNTFPFAYVLVRDPNHVFFGLRRACSPETFRDWILQNERAMSVAPGIVRDLRLHPHRVWRSAHEFL